MPLPQEESQYLRLIKSETDDEASGHDRRQAEILSTLYQRLVDGKDKALRPGDLAQWKPGLSNRKWPAYGVPVIVVGILEQPIYDDNFKSGSCYFRESLDLLVGQLDSEGEFMVFHGDRRRYEPYLRAD
jgi:hypothetical protein